MPTISNERFEELVADALEEIPGELWDAINNLAVTVAEWPTHQQLAQLRLRPGQMLLGLYEGVPLTVRGHHYGLAMPDKITIFRQPILRLCAAAGEAAIQAQVRRTVLHEIAHHFGISDQRLRDLGAY